MGKIILIIYVIAAVASIIAKQIKKKKLLEEAKRQSSNMGNSNTPPERSPQQHTAQKDSRQDSTGIFNPWTKKPFPGKKQKREEDHSSRREQKESMAHQSHQTYQKEESPKISESTEGDLSKPRAKNRFRGKDLFLDIAKEFGLVVDETPPPPRPRSRPQRPAERGQPEEVLTGDYPFVWEEEEPEDIPEGSDTNENREFEEARPTLDPIPNYKKGMGLTQREPQLPPSLAYTPKLSKKDQLVGELKDRASFKKAFLLKTIIDPPLALKGRAGPRR